MNEERMRILTMLSEGKITVEEAERLLSAIGAPDEADVKQSVLGTLGEDKFLYVQVEPKEGKSSERVSVKVPFALLKAGLNIAGLIPAEAKSKIEDSMQEKGLSFDFDSLSRENLQEILTALEQMSVDVDTDEATIQVYCR
jgi:hypothetical protein